MKIIPASYSNVVKRIPIAGVPTYANPSSPTDIQIMSPPSITISLENGKVIAPGPDSAPELHLPPASTVSSATSSEPSRTETTPIKPTQTSG
jgi:hypothetical protein